MQHLGPCHPKADQRHRDVAREVASGYAKELQDEHCRAIFGGKKCDPAIANSTRSVGPTSKAARGWPT
jgi:hypothetical protein